MAVKILTNNVNGLNNSAKRNNIMNFFQDIKYDIYCIQETHSTDETAIEWANEWKNKTNGTSIWNSGNSHKCGVAILFKKDIILKQTTTDKKGRILAVSLIFKKHKIRIINIYAPNTYKNKECFFKKLNKHAHNDDFLFLLGDFNMVENPNIDRQGGDQLNPNHIVGSKNLNLFKELHKVNDVFRTQFTHKQIFTYEKEDKTYRSRIDRIYASSTNQKDCKCTFVKNNLSDHIAVLCKFKIQKTNERGPGYWHLNTNILDDKNFKIKLNTDFEKQKNKKYKYKNNNQWWDIVKSRIKTIAMETKI